MNILFINNFFVGFMVSEIPRVVLSVFVCVRVRRILCVCVRVRVCMCVCLCAIYQYNNMTTYLI